MVSKFNDRWDREKIILNFKKIYKEQKSFTKKEICNTNKKFYFCSVQTLRQQFGTLENFANIVHIKLLDGRLFKVKKWNKEDMIKITKQIVKENNNNILKRDFMKICKNRKLFCIETINRYFGSLDSLAEAASVEFKSKPITKNKIIKFSKIIFNENKNNKNFKRTDFYKIMKKRYNISYKSIFSRYGILDNLSNICDFKFFQKRAQIRQKTKFTRIDIIDSFKKVIINNKNIKKTDLIKYYKDGTFCCHPSTVHNHFESLDELSNIINFTFDTSKIISCIGQHETKLLNNIEETNNIILKRQYPVLNFFIDGYDTINNIAYEIDEQHHKHQQVQDLIRENKIKDKIGCEFVRIKDI